MQASFSEICTRNYRHATKNPELEASGVPGVRDGSETPPPRTGKIVVEKTSYFRMLYF